MIKITTAGLFMPMQCPNSLLLLFLYHLRANVPLGLELVSQTVDYRPCEICGSAHPRYLLDFAWHACIPLIVLSYNSFTALSATCVAIFSTSSVPIISVPPVRKGAMNTEWSMGALRNSMITMITLGSTLLAALFGGFIFVEMIFSIPGLGLLLLDAARQNDAPLIMGSTIISVVLLLLSI